MTTPPLPNPGSREALALGCLCPILDNSHGTGPGPFWISSDCDLHSVDYKDPTDEWQEPRDAGLNMGHP